MRQQSTVNNQRSTVSTLCSGIKSLKQFFLLFTFYFLLTDASAQSVSASLDRDKILLGEQVNLQLNLTNLNPLIAFVAGWPQLPDTLNHIEIIKRSSLDTIQVNGTNSYQQDFILTGFDSGRWQLGPFNFIIQDKTTGKQLKIFTQPVYLTVLPVDVSGMKDYHPLKDVIEVETSFNWLPVIIGIALLIAAVIIIVIIKKRKKKSVDLPKVVLPGTPIERAMQKLQQLQNQALNNDAVIKNFHSDIDIICREYFEETTSMQAMQATTGELLSRMNVFISDANVRVKMINIFDLNASVKFAKYMPAETQSKTILEDVMFNLQQLDKLKQQSIHNANSLA